MNKVSYLIFIAIIIASHTAVAKKEQTITEIGKQYNIPYGVIDKKLLPYAYSGPEKFRFDISYTGGIKIGELYLELQKAEQDKDIFIIRSRATTMNGFFERIYPIEDLHVTQVSGPEKLPFHYELWQEEGYDYKAHRVTRYDQKNLKIYYRHNEYPVTTFTISDTVQNEFSAFFASRLMDFLPGNTFIVPTFADKKRVEVVVMVKDRETLEETLFGQVRTIQVEPIMTFRGLYDKRGDTVIWYTDDQCRVPVLINSKIVIGSLTATLVGYDNPACPRYDGMLLDKYKPKKARKK